MNDRQIKALNSLYAATIEVLEAFAPETVGADQRREALSRMIENFLISASSPDQGIIMPQMPKADNAAYAPRPMEAQTEQAYGSAQTRTSAEENPQPASVSTAPPAPVSAPPSFEIKEQRYATIPVMEENTTLFKRLKSQEGQEPDEYYPYVLQLGDEEGLFSVVADFSTFPVENITDVRFPETVVTFIPDKTMPADAHAITTVEPGKVKKYGKKSWQIIKPAKVKYE